MPTKKKKAKAKANVSRLEARVAKEDHALLKRAAEIEGSSVGHFVIATAREAAKECIARHEEIQLSRAEQKRFAEAILNPPPVAPALREAMKHRERLLEIA